MIKGKEGNLLSRLKVKITTVVEGGGLPGEAGYITSPQYLCISINESYIHESTCMYIHTPTPPFLASIAIQVLKFRMTDFNFVGTII
jgi:predicted metal-binding protein